jgi:hypothetical protein
MYTGSRSATSDLPGLSAISCALVRLPCKEDTLAASALAFTCTDILWRDSRSALLASGAYPAAQFALEEGH